MILLACLVVLVALGLVERLAARRARAAVPIRIHVNGTRGKSTVTRLIAAALREAGIANVAKVTGTAPRLIAPDGSEHPIVRRAPANIREQAWLLREARRAGARAVVAECMAVRPELQFVSEREMVRATIGVITNVRRDHTEVMGQTLEEIAQSLANSIPRRGVLVTGDARVAQVLAARCAPLGTRLVVAENGVGSIFPDAENGVGSIFSCAGWWRQDMAVALAVTREVGISDEVALAGMKKAVADPGTATSGVATIGGREIGWIDATAANDPESLDLLTTGLKPCSTGRETQPPADSTSAGLKPCPTDVIVYNHRADRPDRLRTFARFSDTFRTSAAVLLTGDRPSLTLVGRVRRLCPRVHIRFVSRRDLARAVADSVPGIDAPGPAARVVFCGNTRGFVNPLTGPSRPKAQGLRPKD